MIDEDTGLSFGRLERKVAQVRIVASERARSRAVVVYGGHPEKGDLVRLSKSPTIEEEDGLERMKPRKILQPKW